MTTGPPSPEPGAASLFEAEVSARALWGGADPSGLPAAERAAVAGAALARRREFAAGRLCARAALADLGGPAAEIEADAARAPIWPQGFVGSITHAEGYALAVAGRRSLWRSLGIDAEGADRVTPELWPDILTAAELEALMDLPAADRPQRAAIAFSAKEAFYKAQHPLTGRWIDFLEVEVAVDGARLTVAFPDGAARPPARIRGAWRRQGALVITGFGVPA